MDQAGGKDKSPRRGDPKMCLTHHIMTKQSSGNQEWEGPMMKKYGGGPSRKSSWRWLEKKLDPLLIYVKNNGQIRVSKIKAPGKSKKGERRNTINGFTYLLMQH